MALRDWELAVAVRPDAVGVGVDVRESLTWRVGLEDGVVVRDTLGRVGVCRGDQLPEKLRVTVTV